MEKKTRRISIADRLSASRPSARIEAPRRIRKRAVSQGERFTLRLINTYLVTVSDGRKRKRRRRDAGVKMGSSLVVLDGFSLWLSGTTSSNLETPFPDPEFSKLSSNIFPVPAAV